MLIHQRNAIYIHTKGLPRMFTTTANCGGLQDLNCSSIITIANRVCGELLKPQVVQNRKFNCEY